MSSATEGARAWAADTSSTPEAAPSEPMIRFLGDIASWSLGEPLSAGSDDPLVQTRASALDSLLVALTGDGVRALIAIMRNAAPVRHEDGSAHLELVGYSAKWLRDEVGLSERRSLQVNRLLQDHGLIVTASLPDALGAAGKQRAIVTPKVGAPGGEVDVVPTRRGRGASNAVTTKRQNRPQSPSDETSEPPVTTNRQNGRTDPSAVPTERQNRTLFPQVRTQTTEPQNRSTSSEVGSLTTSLPSDDGPLASLGSSSPSSELRALTAVGSWADLQAALARRQRVTPGAVAAALREVFVAQSSNAGGLAKALRLPNEGEQPVSERAANYAARVLLSPEGKASGPWSILNGARVHIPADEPTEVLAPRLLVTIAAGLDTKVSDWVRWLAKGLQKPTTEWTPTVSVDAMRRVLAALIEDPDAPVEHGAPALPHRSRPTATLDSDSTGTDAGSKEPPEVPVRRLALDEVEALLDEAYAWGRDNGDLMTRQGIEWFRQREHFARALVERYLEAKDA